MRVNKAVIPVAGLGTRFLPATKAQPKVMLPVVDTPALQYVVEEAVRAGLSDILIVTGRGQRSVEDHFDRSIELEHFLEEKGKYDELKQVHEITDMANIHYIRQKDPLGLGHAVSVAANHVDSDSFAVLLGDDLIHPSVPLLSNMLRVHEQHGRCVIAAMEVPEHEIGFYGCIEPGEVDGNVARVVSIIEKPSPEEAPSNLAVIGRYVLTPDIFEALRETPAGRGGEIQLTDAINRLAKEQEVYAYIFDEGRFDVGNKLDYLKATVEFAIERDDVGEEFRPWLAEFVRRKGLE